jgi:hypothetical protein
MLGLHYTDMLAIVPGPPIGLIIVWQVQEHYPTHTQSGMPVVQGSYPIRQVLQAMAAEYVVKQFIGQGIGVGAGIYVGIYHHSSRKGPFHSIASYVQASTAA